MRPLVYIILLSCGVFLYGQNREVLAEYKIGVIGQNTESGVAQAAQTGANDAARALSQKHSIDIQIRVLTPDIANGGSQTDSLGRLLIEETDGLVISPGEPDLIEPLIELAMRNGMEITLFEKTLENLVPLSSVVADELEAGRLAGKVMLSKLPTKGRVAILTAENPSPALEARLEGVREALGYRRIQSIFKTEPTYRAAIEVLQAAEKEDRDNLISGWVLLGDWPLQGMPALPWEARDLPAVAIQSSATSFMYLEQGFLHALIVQPYYDWGYQSVETIVNKLFLGIEPEKSKKVTNPIVVDWQNIEDYRENWKNWLR